MKTPPMPVSHLLAPVMSEIPHTVPTPDCKADTPQGHSLIPPLALLMPLSPAAWKASTICSPATNNLDG